MAAAVSTVEKNKKPVDPQKTSRTRQCRMGRLPICFPANGLMSVVEYPVCPKCPKYVPHGIPS